MKDITQQGLYWKSGQNLSNHNYYLRSQTSSKEGYKNHAAKYLLAQNMFSQKANHVFNDHGKNISIDNLLHEKHGNSRWKPVLSNKWARLTQGNITKVEVTNTTHFIPHIEVPQD